MSKLDIVGKISFKSFVKALSGLATVDFLELQRSTVQFIKQEIGINSLFEAYFFEWGRNALYYFFKQLHFKKIAFPAFTCPTLIEAAEKAQKKIVLIEANLKTFNIDIDKIPHDIDCLFTAHTFGNPVDIQKIRQKFSKLFVIEDCAHALYSRIRDRFTGGCGDAVLFSLYKQIANINGALLFSPKALFPKISSQNTEVGPVSNLRGWKQVQPSKSYCKRWIFKMKGLHQIFLDEKRKKYLPVIEPRSLKNNLPNKIVINLFYQSLLRLKKEVEQRRKLADIYFKEVEKSTLLKTFTRRKDKLSSFYNFPVRLHPEICWMRDKLVFKLRQEKIFLGRLWYDAPVCKRKYSFFRKKCPNALLLSKSIINLPIKAEYNRKDIGYLFKRINNNIQKLQY